MTLANSFSPLQALCASDGEEPCQFSPRQFHLSRTFTHCASLPHRTIPSSFPLLEAFQITLYSTGYKLKCTQGQDGNVDEQSRTGTCRAQAHSESSPHVSVPHSMLRMSQGLPNLESWGSAFYMCYLSGWFCFLFWFFNVNKHGVAETIHVSWQNLRVATCYVCSKISKHVAHVALSAHIPVVPTSATAPQSQVPMASVGPFTIYLF